MRQPGTQQDRCHGQGPVGTATFRGKSNSKPSKIARFRVEPHLMVQVVLTPVQPYKSANDAP